MALSWVWYVQKLYSDMIHRFDVMGSSKSLDVNSFPVKVSYQKCFVHFLDLKLRTGLKWLISRTV